MAQTPNVNIEPRSTLSRPTASFASAKSWPSPLLDILSSQRRARPEHPSNFSLYHGGIRDPAGTPELHPGFHAGRDRLGPHDALHPQGRKGPPPARTPDPRIGDSAC